jgi:hypothetical protein
MTVLKQSAGSQFILVRSRIEMWDTVERRIYATLTFTGLLLISDHFIKQAIVFTV